MLINWTGAMFPGRCLEPSAMMGTIVASIPPKKRILPTGPPSNAISIGGEDGRLHTDFQR
jgi:hypothetical protein